MANIPPIQSGSGTNLPNSVVVSSEAKALAALLQIPVGQQVAAVVAEVSALSKAEQAFLLEKHALKPNTSIAGSGSSATAASNPKALGADSTAQPRVGTRPDPATNKLIKTAPLNILKTSLVRVLIHQKSAHLLSDLPLKAGNEISIRLRPEGQLQMLGLKPAAGALAPTHQAAGIATSAPSAHNSAAKQIPADPVPAKQPLPGAATLTKAGSIQADQPGVQQKLRPAAPSVAIASTEAAAMLTSKNATKTEPVAATKPVAPKQTVPTIAPKVITGTKAETQSSVTPNPVKAAPTGTAPQQVASISAPAKQSPKTSPIQPPALAQPNSLQPKVAMAYAKSAVQAPPPLVAAEQLSLNSLQTALKAVMPKANNASLLLNSAAHIPTRLPKLASHSPAVEAVANALRALAQVKTQPLDINQLLKNPLPAFKGALEQSGVFYERKIAQLANSPTLGAALEQDFKRVLLNAATSLQLAAESLGKPMDKTSQTVLEQLLKVFFKPEIGLSKPRAFANTSDAQKLVNQFAGQVRSAVANIQMQQYRTASSLLTEPIQNTQTFFTDVPIRLFHGFGNIFMQWQEQQREQKKASKQSEKKSRKKTKWQVYMELELQEEGNLAIELNLLEAQINAQIWADTPALHQKAAGQLTDLKHDLETQGFTVTEIRCHDRKSQQQGVSLNCSLVDVKT